jgi:hypothetical protein
MEIACLETTFFSFYHDARPAPAIVAMRDWTRQFWDERRDDYTLVTSEAVLDELRKGGAHHKKPALELALTLPLIPAGNQIAEIVRTYVKHKIMPADPAAPCAKSNCYPAGRAMRCISRWHRSTSATIL